MKDNKFNTSKMIIFNLGLSFLPFILLIVTSVFALTINYLDLSNYFINYNDFSIYITSYLLPQLGDFTFAFTHIFLTLGCFMIYLIYKDFKFLKYINLTVKISIFIIVIQAILYILGNVFASSNNLFLKQSGFMQSGLCWIRFSLY